MQGIFSILRRHQRHFHKNSSLISQLSFCILMLSVSLFASESSAYTFNGGDFSLKANAGAGVNLLRSDVATKRTPEAGMLFTLDADYALTGEFHLVGSLRPQASSNFLDSGIGLGVAYRAVRLNAPFVPYVSAMMTSALGLPFSHGDVHFNLGTRFAAGVDYFIMRQFYVGIEIAGEGSLMAFPLLMPEMTTEMLLGVGWRF